MTNRPDAETAPLATNTQVEFGFQPFGSSAGVTPNFGLRRATIAYNYGTALYKGDPVSFNSSGVIVIAPNANGQIDGIFWGCEYQPSGSATALPIKSPTWPGVALTNSSAIVTCFIIDDPNVLFRAATFGTLSGGLTQASVGDNIEFHTGTGNATTGLSGYTIDDGNIATTSTYPFKIVDLYSTYAPPGVNGSAANQYNWAIVKMNNSGRAAGTTGV